MIEIRGDKKVLITPVSAEDLKDIHIGDIVWLDGDLMTCRDVAHRRLVEYGRVQAKAHHTQIEGDEYGQKDGCGGDGIAPGEGDQIEQVADPGGQQKIGQQHRPEGGLGRAHIRPGPALEFFAVNFHGFLRCNV